MPSDYPRPALKSFEGDRVIKRFDETVTARLRRLGQEAGATLYMVLLAIFNITVSKYTSQEDIIIGTPVSTRGHSYLNNIVGLFINMLAMRNCANGYKTFSEFLGEVKENAIRAFENRDYQFEELVSRLNLKRDMSRNPLFDIVFALQNNEAVKRSKRDISIIPRDKKLYTSKFDITLNVIEMNDFLELEFEYCTKLFKKETIERFISCFENITKEVIDDPNLKLSDIKPIPNDEIYHIIHDFNDTAREYEKDKTIHGQFEEQAARTPDGIAVIYGDKGITYRELNEKANRIARRLREKGTVRDSIVGIMVDRSIEMIIGIMAVLKAGGAYLPIDPSYPRDRISFMIKDSGTRILLTEGKYLDTAACVKGEVIDIRDAGTYHEDGSNVKNENAPEDLAYVIYTSGSTGKPKGVMIEHRSVFFAGMEDKIDFSPSKTIMSLTTISFDIFVLETLLPLTKGMTVVVAGEEEQRDHKRLRKAIIRNNVEMLQMTPSRLQLMVSDGNGILQIDSIKELMVGGEAFPQRLLEKVREQFRGRIYNMYGPTETTVWSTVKELTGSQEVTIGKPIANTQVYILDKYQKVVPVGVEGELYISGDGLARGYLNRSELTREKFVSNPFIPGAKMYRTGDMARWLPDGEIEFVGRTDYQVKIRGFRIELAEIEACLLEHEEIREAVVNVKGDGLDRFICAYIVPSGEIDVISLRRFLTRKLPSYMIPQYFIKMDKLPLTSNHKIDRYLLPEPDIEESTGNEYAAPQTEIQTRVLEIWQSVLGRERIGIKDNFFDIGGNSISLIHMHNQLDKIYPGAVKITDIFGHPTILKISDLISRMNEPKGKELRLELLPLQSDYFISKPDNTRGVSFKFDIVGPLFAKFMDKSKEIDCTIGDILLSIYIYLLGKISGESSVSVQVMIGNFDEVLQLCVDMASINDFTELAGVVSTKAKIHKEGLIYRVKELDGSHFQKKGNFILPVFYKSSLLNSDVRLTDYYDIALGTTELEQKVQVLFSYNSRRLKKEKVKELVKNYSILVNSF